MVSRFIQRMFAFDIPGMVLETASAVATRLGVPPNRGDTAKFSDAFEVFTFLTPFYIGLLWVAAGVASALLQAFGVQAGYVGLALQVLVILSPVGAVASFFAGGERVIAMPFTAFKDKCSPGFQRGVFLIFGMAETSALVYEVWFDGWHVLSSATAIVSLTLLLTLVGCGCWLKYRRHNPAKTTPLDR